MVEISLKPVDEAKKQNVTHIVKLFGFGSDKESKITMHRLHHQVEETTKSSGINYTFYLHWYDMMQE